MYPRLLVVIRPVRVVHHFERKLGRWFPICRLQHHRLIAFITPGYLSPIKRWGHLGSPPCY